MVTTKKRIMLADAIGGAVGGFRVRSMSFTWLSPCFLATSMGSKCLWVLLAIVIQKERTSVLRNRAGVKGRILK